MSGLATATPAPTATGTSATSVLPKPSLSTAPDNKVLYGCIVLFIISASTFITSFVMTTLRVNNATDYNLIKEKMGIIMGLSITATVFFMIASTLFFYKKNEYSTSFSVAVSCFALGIAFSSLAVASISKKYG